jgi:hypothetical protein
MLRSKLSPDMTFDEAAALWLEGRSALARSLSSSTAHHWGKSNSLTLPTIRRPVSPAMTPFIRFRRPQDAIERKVGDTVIPAKGKTPCPAQPQKVNQELGLLKAIMILAACWDQEINAFYEPFLIEGGDIPRALSPEEQRHWLAVAQTRNEWNVVYWYCLLAFDTCMSTNEIRGLRLGDVNLQQRVLVVPRRVAKNKYRNRTIELVGADVLWALERLIERANECGSVDHQHYLFPFRPGRGPFEPSRPMTSSGLKRPWEEIRKASGLMWFRMYDTRHTAITRAAEEGTNIAVIKSFAGHVSNRMNEHYTHVSQSAQRHAREYARPAAYANQLRRRQPMLLDQSSEGSPAGRYSSEAPSQQLAQRSSAEAWETPGPRHVTDARETSPPLQAAAVEATPRQQGTLSPSIGSAGEFYATSWTW